MVMCLIASLWAPFLTLLILLQLPLKIWTIKPLSLYLLHWPLRTSRGVTSYCHDEGGGYQMLPPLRAPPWARTHALQRARQPEGFSLSIPLTVWSVGEKWCRKSACWPKDIGANRRETFSDTPTFSKTKRFLKKK